VILFFLGVSAVTIPEEMPDEYDEDYVSD